MSGVKEKNTKQNIFKSRGFKFGTLATALTAILIIVVIAANMVLSVLSDKFAWSFDLTSTDMYDISDATKTIVETLDKDVEIKITVFCAEDDFPYFLREPLKRFCNLSNQISYSYVDLEKNPAAATQFGTEYSITTYSVAITSGDRVKVYNVSDYYEEDSEGSGAVDISIEEKLAAGTLYVTKDDIPVVYFVGGHGEDGYTSLMNLIANNGADVEAINLATDKVEFSPYSKLMVICNPIRDYSESEIRLIEDFLNNGNKFGRNLMFFSSAENYELPNLEKFLATWGFKFNKDTVYDDTNNYGQIATSIIPELATDEIMNTGKKLSSVTASIIPGTRSIDLLFEESGLYSTQEIFASNIDTSYSRDAGVISNEPGRLPADKSGPHCTMALSMKYKYENNIQVQSYVLASGSTEMLGDAYLKYTGNGEVLMQLYKLMMNEQDDTIASAKKTKSAIAATVTATQMRVVAIVTLGVIPLIFLIAGVVVFIRRRFL